MTHSSLPAVLASVRGLLRFRLGLSFGVASLAVAASILALAWWLAGAEGWRPGTAVPAILLLGGIVGVGTIGAWTMRLLGRWTSEPSVSAEIERCSDLPEGSVRAQSELGRELPRGVSASLAEAGERALLLRIREGPARLAGRAGQRALRLQHAASAGAAVAVLLASALWWVSPERARAAWSGLAEPRNLLTRPVLPPLGLLPGNAELPRGEAPAIDVVAPGRDSVTVHWRAVGEVEAAEAAPVAEGRSRVRLPPLQVETRYWATSPDGARSETFLLTPADPSLLSNVRLEVRYPAHTRLPPEEFFGSPSVLSVPEGSVLRFSGEVRGETGDVRLVDAALADSLRMPVEGGRFSGSFTARRSALLEWQVRGGETGALLPSPLELEVVEDQSPRLSFPEPGSAGELPLSLTVPLLLEAVDDYGIAWIEVETSLRSPAGADAQGVSDGGREVEREGSTDRISTGDRPSVTLRPLLDFTSWELRPGEEVLIRARASDNAPAPHIVESETYVLRMPVLRELRDLARSTVDSVTLGAEELLRRAQEEERALRDLERRTRMEQQDSQTGPVNERERFQQREEIQQALERQTEMVREIEELRDQLADAAAVLPDEEEQDQGLAERIEELEALLQGVMSEEERARLEELLEDLQGGEATQESLAEVTAEMAERQRQMRERLEQTIERLRRAVLEEAFRGAEEEVRSLAEAQTEAADSLRAGDGPERQQEIAEQTERTQERIDNLGDQLRAQAEPEAADRADQAEAELGAARERMEQAVQEAQSGDPQAAGDQAAQAAESLQSALEQLQDGRAGMEESWQEAMAEGLRAGARDAVALARRQGELRDDFASAGPQRRAEFEGEQSSIVDGLRNLANGLAEAAAQVPAVAAQLSEAVGRAIAAAREAMEGLPGTGAVRPTTEASAEAAQRAINDVALMALAGLAQGGQEGESGATMSQIRAEMEALAAAQESVNRGASSLGQDPGQDGATARVEQLAQTQETIAGSLGEMSRRPGAGRTPVDLEALSEEARALAEQLRERRLAPENLERQDRFLELLLSAGLSLERDEPTEERESRAADPTPRTIGSPIPEYLLDARAIPFPTAEELEALTPAQRRLVLDYFERVNERRSRGAQ